MKDFLVHTRQGKSRGVAQGFSMSRRRRAGGKFTWKSSGNETVADEALISGQT